MQPRRHLNTPAPHQSRAPAHRQVPVAGCVSRLLSWHHAWACAPACTTSSVMLKQGPACACCAASPPPTQPSPPPPQGSKVSCPAGYASSCQIGVGQVCDVITPGCLSAGVQVKGKQCCCCPTSGQPPCGLALLPCTSTGAQTVLTPAVTHAHCQLLLWPAC